MALGEVGKKFMEESSRKDERGVFHVTQKDYMKYMAEQGVSKEIIESVSSANQELVNGMYLFGDTELNKKVDEDKKNGGDGKDQKVEMSVNIPNGSVNMTVHSHKSYPVPRTDERVDKVNVTSLVINQSRLLNKDILAQCETEMKKKLGL